MPTAPPRRKRFGQHFLHESSVIERLLAALRPQPADRLVEIGAGKGFLTRALLGARAETLGPTPATLDAIEIDRDLVAHLRREFAGDTRLVLHEADALEFDFRALAAARGGPLRVVGNLPYNISTPLLFRVIHSRAAIIDLHCMLQREVVARLAAGPGDDAYGRLSVMLAPWMDVEWLFDVGPGAFQPPPRVWSSVVRLQVLPAARFAVSDHFAAVVAAAFAHRRKTIRNALRGLLTAEEIMAAGVDPGVRPETLPPEAFNTMAQKIVRS
jgi:16S rRNA (adenine1518-N6/adenine1519-N6)-dimethyltransferase